MVPDGPEALLLGSRTIYGRELDTYARLEYPRDTLYWVEAAAPRRAKPLLPVGHSRRTPGGVRRALLRVARALNFASGRSGVARKLATAP